MLKTFCQKRGLHATLLLDLAIILRMYCSQARYAGISASLGHLLYIMGWIGAGEWYTTRQFETPRMAERIRNPLSLYSQ